MSYRSKSKLRQPRAVQAYGTEYSLIAAVAGRNIIIGLDRKLQAGLGGDLKDIESLQVAGASLPPLGVSCLRILNLEPMAKTAKAVSLVPINYQTVSAYTRHVKGYRRQRQHLLRCYAYLVRKY